VQVTVAVIVLMLRYESAVNPEVPITAWATRARRAAKSAIPSQRWSAACGTDEPSDQAANNRAVPAATVRAPAATTRPAICTPPEGGGTRPEGQGSVLAYHSAASEKPISR
jgi:hypothetical protein